MANPTSIRLLVAEDVPQVSQHVRNLLSVQAQVKLLEVLSDGSKVVEASQQLRPDVVLVDLLLQGKMKGPQLIEKLRDSGLDIPVVVLTVPQHPLARDPERGVDAVLTLPFSGFELVNTLAHVLRDRQAQSAGACRVVSVFSPKGGVGKTTIAFNLAVALSQLGASTALIDGSLQYGDLRALLKVPSDVPSILDLPTDRVQESDLREVMWRDPAGIDILLAPPRVEMAEMVTPRDVEKTVSLLRRLYHAVVIDTPSVLSEITLGFLDASDVIVSIVTYDSTTIHNTIAVSEAFASIGYSSEKVHYLVNRSDSSGGISREELVRALGRKPEFEVVSDGRLVVQANNEGMPFVVSSPDAAVSRDVRRIATTLLGRPVGAIVRN
ncbi:MAG TPA: response regulator [Candidatus Limnocylindrales bacterium]